MHADLFLGVTPELEGFERNSAGDVGQAHTLMADQHTELLIASSGPWTHPNRGRPWG
jgi:hypothetical protein